MSKLSEAKVDRPKTWRRSIEKDGMTKSIEVREIENGFIIRYCKYGHYEENSEYTDITKEFYSKDNPLDKGKDKEEEGLLNDMKEVFSFDIENYL